GHGIQQGIVDQLIRFRFVTCQREGIGTKRWDHRDHTALCIELAPGIAHLCPLKIAVLDMACIPLWSTTHPARMMAGALRFIFNTYFEHESSYVPRNKHARRVAGSGLYHRL